MMKSVKIIAVLFLLLSFASSGIASEDIFSMVKEGDIDGVRKIITETKDINTRNEFGATPLHIAVSRDSAEIVELLIDASADVNAKDNYGSTPLHVAALLGFPEIVELLINASADVNATNERGLTALHHILSPMFEDHPAFHADYLGNKIQVFKLLLSSGADINVQANRGETPLMIVSVLHKRTTDVQFISQVLEIFSGSDANLNAQNNIGATALSLAASAGNDSFVAWLIQNNADISLCNDNMVTPLHWAAIKNNEYIAQMLINAGADVNVKCAKGGNALMYATLGGNLNIVLALLERGAEVNLYMEGFTPLHAATGLGVINFNERIQGESYQETIRRLGFSEDNFLQMTKALVEAGANVFSQGRPLRWHDRLRSRTPYDFAVGLGHREVANYLRGVMRGAGRRWFWPF